ncbi:TetR family transcriptional regulator [Comamonadaceae bacterium OH2310_COT-174]|nr:TetR family transcriptional regulator [Comamonadaceae bacterium OH2310_COT-174]
MRRTKAQAQETRDQLMRAALDVFDQRGVSRASLNEIAQCAGVTRGALYWHFKNKEDLFDALFQHIFEDLSHSLAEDIRNQAPDMLQSLRQALLNNFERIEHNALHHKFCRILYLKCEHTEDNAAILGVMDRYQDMWSEQIHSALRLCVQQQRLPQALDIALAAVYLKSVVFGLIELWLIRPEQLDLGRTAPRIVDAALHALQHTPFLQTTQTG